MGINPVNRNKELSVSFFSLSFFSSFKNSFEIFFSFFAYQSAFAQPESVQ